MLAPLRSGQSANSCADTVLVDIEFHCPECQQPLAIDGAAAGAQVACPRCQRVLSVPASAHAAVALGVPPDPPPTTPGNEGAHEELERKEKELATALEEAARLREEKQRSQDELEKLREDFSTAASDREGLRGNLFGPEVERLAEMEGRFKTELEEVRVQLVEAIRDRDTLAQRLEALARNTDHGSAASAELERVREDLHYARAELAATAEQRAVLQVDAGRRESEFKALVTSLKAEIGDTLSAARVACEQAASAERQREQLETQLSSAMNWKSEAVAGRTLVTRLQDQITASLTERESLKINLGHATTEVKTLQSALDTTKTQLEAEHGKLRELTDRSAELERERIKFQCERTQPEAIAPAQSENQILQAQLIDSQRSLVVMRLERDKVRAQLQEREEAMRKAAATVDVARAELERRRQEHSDLSGAQEQLKTALADALEEAKELQQRVDSLLDNLHAREGELGETRQTLATSIVVRNEARTQIAGVLCEHEKLKVDLAEANRRTETTRQRLEAAEARARQWQLERDEMFANLEVARREREGALSTLSVREADVRAASTRLWEEAAVALEKLTELERRLESAHAETDAIRMDLEAARGERDEIARSAAAKDAEMREVTAQSERQKTVEHTFLLHLQAAETNVAAAREKTALLESEREGVNAELANARAAFKEVCEQLEQVKSEREAARAALIGMEVELEKSLDQRHALENDRDGLGADLGATRAGLERAKQHINALQTRRDQMRDEVARLKVQLGMAPDPRG